METLVGPPSLRWLLTRGALDDDVVAGLVDLVRHRAHPKGAR
jgi:hypothetical protein